MQPSIALFLVLAACTPASAATPVEGLREWLAKPVDIRGDLAGQPFADAPLSRELADEARQVLWNDFVVRAKSSRQEAFDARRIEFNGAVLKYDLRRFGEPGPNGRSLFISMHGGGGAPARVNDQQWENQKRLYRPEEGLYVAPRAPADAWNMWFQDDMDPLFDQLIADLVVFENVDPDRVYLMGYSAGGDGAYALAPRFADRLAAAAAMAGHPNATSPLGLRNLPFALYCGGKDAAYGRNKIAAAWKQKFDDLEAADPGAYVHRAVIYPDKGHWMDREDAEAVPWMAKYTRQSAPQKIIWQTAHARPLRFYWIAADKPLPAATTHVEVAREGNRLRVLQSSHARELTVLLNDAMVDLEQPVEIVQSDRVLSSTKAARTIRGLWTSLTERADPRTMSAARVTVAITADPARDSPNKPGAVDDPSRF